MTFVIEGSGVRLVEMQCVHDAIKEKYEQKLRAKENIMDCVQFVALMNIPY